MNAYASILIVALPLMPGAPSPESGPSGPQMGTETRHQSGALARDALVALMQNPGRPDRLVPIDRAPIRYHQWIPALWRRVLTPKEIAQYESVLTYLRSVDGQEFYASTPDAGVLPVIRSLLSRGMHASVVPELLRFLEHHNVLGGEEADAEVPAALAALAEALARTHDRRVYKQALQWYSTGTPGQRALGRLILSQLHQSDPVRLALGELGLKGTRAEIEAARRLLRSRLLWPSPMVPLAWGIVCPDPPRGRVVPQRAKGPMPRRPWASFDRIQYVHGVLASLRTSDEADPFRSRSDGPPRPGRVDQLLESVARSRSFPTWQRAQAVEFISRADAPLLLELALAPADSFESEVLAIAATCRLAQLGELKHLVTVLDQGCESAAFQAASHLQYVGGVRLPRLVIVLSEDAGPYRLHAADLARWLVDPDERSAVVRKLRRMLRRGRPPDRAGGVSGWRRHVHVDVHSPEAWSEIPAAVLARSRMQDPFWRPLDSPNRSEAAASQDQTATEPRAPSRADDANGATARAAGQILRRERRH